MPNVDQWHMVSLLSVHEDGIFFCIIYVVVVVLAYACTRIRIHAVTLFVAVADVNRKNSHPKRESCRFRYNIEAFHGSER